MPGNSVKKSVIPDEVSDPPNVFDEQSFTDWLNESPDELLWRDQEHVENLRVLKTQLVEETQLSEREAEVLLLRLEGYNYYDIGAQLDIGASTCREYGQRAREKIQKAAWMLQLLKAIDEDWLRDTISPE